MQEIKYPLGWGETVCVREALDAYYKGDIKFDIRGMAYCDYNGLPELVEKLKALLGYKHILITAGTTQSINVVLRALQRAEGRNICVTDDFYFPFYPDMISKNNYEHKKGLFKNTDSPDKKLILIDVPSNPWGHVYSIKTVYNNVIWDSVYANPVYMNNTVIPHIDHRVNVGSFSKWLGLTGLRVGWIATNSEEDFKLFFDELKFEACTISVPGQVLLNDILNKVDLEKFSHAANLRVNMNREEFSKLATFFDNQPVPKNGMFYTVRVTDKGRSIIEKAGVGFIELERGNNESLIRFNLAQNNKLTRDAVKAIKTADRLKK